MSVFVLVHGSFHGGWAWSRLIPFLERAGHKAVAPNLPASADDPAPLGEANLAGYARRIAEVIDRQSEPVILVGHSMGGIVITQTAELRPERIRLLVYVCGFLPVNGEDLLTFLDESKGLAGEELVLKNMRIAEDGKTATFDPTAAKDVFYNCCRDEDAAWAAGLLRPQPLAVYQDKVHITDGRFGRVPRVYCETLRDRAIDPAYQKKMHSRTPCRQVIALDADHTPFLAMPEAFAMTLMGLV
jgi:pimeloyl-ACP methyl ester carboxylesterase